LRAIRPGAKARDVDSAAREVIRSRGCLEQFKHGAGHGVGFELLTDFQSTRREMSCNSRTSDAAPELDL
jgi:Xaa-Pro aminopeptidase